MKSSVTLSIVICTYNRAHSLSETLDSLKGLDTDGLRGEIILVDNNSSDATRDTIEAFIPRAPMTTHYVFEPRQGLSHARNTGVDVAKGDVVVFSDDDVLFDRRWLREIAAAFAEPSVAAIGGKILPKWPAPPPDWLGPELHSFLALLDHGDDPVEMKEPALWGANLAFRRDVFRTVRFHAALGRIGDKLYNGEDSDLLQQLIARGERVLYWPHAVVHHNIPEQRLTKAYFRKWHWDAGSMAAQRMPRRIARSLLGIPYHFYRRTAADLAAWSHLALKRESDAFLRELQLVRTAGFAATRMRGLLQRDVDRTAA
jgi:glycosyltransferase involved in cell wall biosynthesis